MIVNSAGGDPDKLLELREYARALEKAANEGLLKCGKCSVFGDGCDSRPEDEEASDDDWVDADYNPCRCGVFRVCGVCADEAEGCDVHECCDCHDLLCEDCDRTECEECGNMVCPECETSTPCVANDVVLCESCKEDYDCVDCNECVYGVRP